MADPTVEKSPGAGVSVNRPESGTFGEKADTQALKDSLPAMGPGQATPGLEPSPMPSPSGGMPAQAGGRPPNAPAGVPSVLMGEQAPPIPSEQANAPAANPQAARISLLEQLVSSEEVSETTREWAKIVLEGLRGEPGVNLRA